MALVTIQRSPSNSNSISSSSDSGGGGVRDEDNQRVCKSLNECYFAGKGTALMLGSNERLQRGDGRRFSQISNELSASQTSIGSSADIQQHLQSMFYLLRPEETLKMAVKLESLRAGRTRYLVVVSRPAVKQPQHFTAPCHITNSPTKLQQSTTTATTTTDTVTSSHLNAESHQTSSNNNSSISLNPTSYFNEASTSDASRSSANMTICDNDSNDDDNNTICPVTDDNQCETESNVGSSCSRSSSNEIEESCLLGIDCNEKTTVGLVLKVLADTAIRLDGDGGFSVSVCGRQHIFKPVSVQAMWSALQTLYKISSKAQEQNFFAAGPSHEWVQYYENRIESDRSCLNEWHAMDSLESRRPPSPDTIRNKPTERDETERVIRTALKEIMMSVDLDEVTSKYIRGRLEEHLDMDLGEFKSFIDEEMLVILGQMDAPTEIFEHVYLGSEWNASNLEELQRNGVRHILNVTREIDNFFPGMFDYFNVRVYDDEKTDLLKHWDNTFKYISRAKMEGSKVLVHCKMGISRSASVVIAYAMKAYDWDFDQAIKHVKEKRNCIKPNKNFVSQLETYQGILDAMKNKEKLQRSKSETNLKSENAKEGKLLPGSEPTPLIQALERNKNSTYPSSKKEASYLKRISQRPSSSPDISKSSSEATSIAKPISLSLETLVTVDATQEQHTSASETTNLRWPCHHGHYSISQNQIIYLENEHSNPQEIETTIDASIVAPLVRSIITELEQHQEKLREEKLKSENKENKESWDPGEGKQEQKQQVYTCSAEIIRQDSFNTPIQITKSPSGKNDTFSKQVDRVFDREEKHRLDPQFVSRQSSWSSVDSACIIGDLPSRNSSWGSGDNNRTLPSRNSSWGSYDTKMQQTVLAEDVVMGQSGIFPYEKDEIPWHPGTVKRTKQKIEEKQVPIMRSASGPSYQATSTTSLSTIDAKNNNNNNKILCDIKKSLLIDNLTNRTGKGSSSPKQPQKFAKLQQSSSVSSAAIKGNNKSGNMRCRSEEYLSAQRAIRMASSVGGNDNNNNNAQQLSASAPETFCLSFMSDHDDVPTTKTSTLKLQQRRQQFKKPGTYTTDDSCDKKLKRGDNQQGIGKVKNLKMNFEAKANNTKLIAATTGAATSGGNKKNCHSLPSSPIAIHIDVSSASSDGFPSANTEDIKTLIDRYDGVAKMRNILSPNIRQRPKSLFETKFNVKSYQSKPSLITHQTILQKSDDYKRLPPIPSQQQPTVKNALMTSNQNMKNVGNCRKNIQQHGKTHPLTKLIIMNENKIEDINEVMKISEVKISEENPEKCSGKREDYLDWEEYFMGIAFLAAQRSKDPVTQVGACIVNEEKKIVAIGYNGFPMNCADDIFPWTKHSSDPLENKYMYVCHAESTMDLKLFAFIFLVVSGVKSDEDAQNEVDTTIVLTDSNFEDVLKTNNFFVMFFAPWCGHCTRLKPTWSQLAEMLNTQEESRVRIARVDCTEHQKTCSDNDVTSYPTLKFFKTGEEPVKYRSTRDLPSLTEFINQQLDTLSSDEEDDSEEAIEVPGPLKGLVVLTDKNFAAQTANGNWFIKFYAPWCGHCQKLAPTFEELARSVEHDTTVTIAKIDCTEYRPICKDYDVKGYPTLLWFENGKKVDKYTGPRSLQDLKAYVEQRSSGEGGEKEAEKVEVKEDGEGAAVLQLTLDSFKQSIESGVTFVKFFAPWCGHCKRLAPTWQQLAEKFVGDADVKIAKVDCTLQDNRELCSEQDVNGFPTLYIYKNGDKVTEYNGSRSLDDLHNFVKSHISEKARDELAFAALNEFKSDRGDVLPEGQIIILYLGSSDCTASDKYISEFKIAAYRCKKLGASFYKVDCDHHGNKKFCHKWIQPPRSYPRTVAVRDNAILELLPGRRERVAKLIKWVKEVTDKYSSNGVKKMFSSSKRKSSRRPTFLPQRGSKSKSNDDRGRVSVNATFIMIMKVLFVFAALILTVSEVLQEIRTVRGDTIPDDELAIVYLGLDACTTSVKYLSEFTAADYNCRKYDARFYFVICDKFENRAFCHRWIKKPRSYPRTIAIKGAALLSELPGRVSVNTTFIMVMKVLFVFAALILTVSAILQEIRTNRGDSIPEDELAIVYFGLKECTMSKKYLAELSTGEYQCRSFPATFYFVICDEFENKDFCHRWMPQPRKYPRTIAIRGAALLSELGGKRARAAALKTWVKKVVDEFGPSTPVAQPQPEPEPVAPMFLKTLLLLAFLITLVKSVNGRPNSADDGSDYVSQPLTKSNYEKVLQENENVFVKFFTYWCYYSKQVFDTWEDLGEHYTNSKDVKIAEIDCENQKPLCKLYKVRNYPSFLMFKNGVKKRKIKIYLVVMRNTNVLAAFVLFVSCQAQKSVVELNSENYLNYVSDESGCLFVRFYATWCRDCSSFTHKWEEVGSALYDYNCVIADFDCALYSDICDLFEIKNYPTYMYMESGVEMLRFKKAKPDRMIAFGKRMFSNRKKREVVEEAVKEIFTDNIIEIFGSNFKTIISKNLTLVIFCVPWCQHCKKELEAIEEVSKIFAKDKKVKIRKLDCHKEENLDTCYAELDNGVPTIAVFKNGKRILKDFSGSTVKDCELCLVSVTTLSCAIYCFLIIFYRTEVFGKTFKQFCYCHARYSHVDEASFQYDHSSLSHQIFNKCFVFSKKSKMSSRLVYQLIIFLILLHKSNATSDHSIQLNDDNFEKELKDFNYYVIFVKENGKSLHYFLSFWSKIANLYNSDNNSTLRIGKVDCETSRKLCEDQNIDDILILKFFGKEGDDFEWKPIYDFLVERVDKNVLNARKQKEILTKLDKGTMLVNFFVPTCKHSKAMAEDWKRLENAYKDDKFISVMSIDCNKNSWVCDNYDITRYPTILSLMDGNKLNKYAGSRSFEDFSNYIENVLKKVLELEDFLSFWNKISNLYTNPDETIRLGKVLCSENEKLCQDNNVKNILELRYFPRPNDNFDSKPIFDFLTETIDKTLKKIQERKALDEKINKGNAFVKFTFPNCPYCKDATIVWGELEKAHKNDDRFSLLSVCCKTYPAICDRFGVKKYPIVQYIKDGNKMQQFKGSKTLENLEKFFSDNLPKPETTTTKAPTTTAKPADKVKPIELTAETFHDVLSTDYTYVLYFLRKCKYCKGYPELWQSLAEHYAGNDKIKIATVNCDRQTRTCIENSKGCPTLSLYHNGERIMKDYYRDNSLKGLIDLLDAHTTGGEHIKVFFLSLIMLIDYVARNMRTKKLASLCLIVVTCLSIFLLIYSLTSDMDARDHQIISSEDNFRELINTDNSFLLFYLRSDGDQPDLLNTWKKLANTVKVDYKGIHVAKFDCSVYRPICEGIGAGPNFPSIVWMQHGKIVSRYEGYLELESLKTFVFDMSRSLDADAKNSNESDGKNYEGDVKISDEIDDEGGAIEEPVEKKDEMDVDLNPPGFAVPIDQPVIIDEGKNDSSKSSGESENESKENNQQVVIDKASSKDKSTKTSSSQTGEKKSDNNAKEEIDNKTTKSSSEEDQQNPKEADDEEEKPQLVKEEEKVEVEKEKVEEEKVEVEKVKVEEEKVEEEKEKVDEAKPRRTYQRRQPNRVPLPDEMFKTRDGRVMKVVKGSRTTFFKEKNKDNFILPHVDEDQDVKVADEDDASTEFNPPRREKTEKTIVIGGDDQVEEDFDSSELLKPREPNIVDIGAMMAEKPKKTKHSEELEEKLNLKVKLSEKKKINQFGFMELSSENFTTSLNPFGLTLVMMYKPNSEKSDTLREVLKDLATKNKDMHIRVAEIDCESNEDFCTEHAITVFPTLNLYRRKGVIVHDFPGRTYKEIEDLMLNNMKPGGIRSFKTPQNIQGKFPVQENDSDEKENLPNPNANEKIAQVIDAGDDNLDEGGKLKEILPSDDKEIVQVDDEVDLDKKEELKEGNADDDDDLDKNGKPKEILPSDDKEIVQVDEEDDLDKKEELKEGNADDDDDLDENGMPKENLVEENIDLEENADPKLKDVQLDDLAL
ncbi:CLUMA_CG009948, isoform B [Clunio marinus]|uniref:protein-serine/threonine phosphatase n=1 Tax=Clunio marinus TaxID=568069 RepID=A0A1J1I965_9DIPT|nr:CLUMA_CG009948, isoform B [Clunio marinus]